jgi:hypothetical protein
MDFSSFWPYHLIDGNSNRERKKGPLRRGIQRKVRQFEKAFPIFFFFFSIFKN